MPQKDPFICRCKFSDSQREFEIDLLNLKAIERIELEEFFDQPWADLWRSGWLLRSTKGSTFIAYLARKRKEPEFTYAQALEFEAEAAVKDDEEPKKGGKAKRPTKTQPKAGSRS